MRTDIQKAKRNQRIAIKKGTITITANGRLRNAAGVFVKKIVDQSFIDKKLQTAQ